MGRRVNDGENRDEIGERELDGRKQTGTTGVREEEWSLSWPSASEGLSEWR